MAMVMCQFFNIIANIHIKFGCFHKKEASLKMILRQRAFCGILEKSYSDWIKSMNYAGYWELCYQRNFHKMKI